MQFRLKARRPQHPHRIFAIARLRIADQLQAPRRDILCAADVVPQGEIGDVVVKRVGGEIPPPHILVDRAVDVVINDAPGLIEKTLRIGIPGELHIQRFGDLGILSLDLGFLIVFGLRIRQRLLARRRCGCRTERCHLDDVPSEIHVCQTEPPPDEAAISEQLAHLVRQRVGCNVKILRLNPQQ